MKDFLPINVSFRRGLIEKRVPLMGTFELTHLCNLRCKHCFVRIDDKRACKGELNTKQVCRIIKQLSAAGAIIVNLTGGEPLLRPDFKDIYLYARKENLAVALSTNATLLTKDLISMFVNFPPFAINVSSYGATQQIYEKITGIRGSFRRYEEALELLRVKKFRTLLRFVIMRDNYFESTRVEDLAKKMGFGFRLSFFLVTRRDKNKAKNKVIQQQQPTASQVIRTMDAHRLPRELVGPFLKDGHYIKGCGAAGLGFHVNALGHISSCVFIPEPAVDLKKNKCALAWEKIRLPFDPFQAKEIACGACSYKDSCLWCPASAYWSTGSYFKKIPYLCKLMKALKR